jgi:hypothetical protein
VASAPLFREAQRFGGASLPALLGVGSAGLLAVLVLLGLQDSGPAAIPRLAALAATWLVLEVLLVLSLVTRLETEVRAEGLFVRLLPFQRAPRRIPFERALRLEAVTYQPLREYRGWGLRRGATGPSYTAWGDRGVLLTFPDGSTALIGSRRADQLAAALRALKGPG